MAEFGKRVSIHNVKVKAMFDGTSGSGKTVSALRFAYGLAGPGGVVGAICSEGGRIEKYALRFPDLCAEIMPGNYAPDEYIKLIEKAEKAGLDVLVIDGVSHEWQGRGGIMEMLDTIGNRNGSPWKTVTPLHRRFTEKILTARLHIVMTCRVDTEWVYETQQRGDRKITIPRKVGMKLQQRPGFEYDLDLWFRMDDDHRAWVQKTNFDAVFPSRVDISMIEESHGQALRDWLLSVTPDQAAQIESAREESQKEARKADEESQRTAADDIMHEMQETVYGSVDDADHYDAPETEPSSNGAAPADQPAQSGPFEICTAKPGGKALCGARLYPDMGEEYDGKTYKAKLIIDASRKEFDRVLCGPHLYQARQFKKKQATAKTA